jgi:hypothetical protein
MRNQITAIWLACLLRYSTCFRKKLKKKIIKQTPVSAIKKIQTICMQHST